MANGIMLFDENVSWLPVTNDMDESTARRHYAANNDRLCILVVHEEAAVDPCFNGISLNLHGLKADVSIGDHDPIRSEAPIGYTRPEYSGYKHSKISVRRFVGNDVEVDWKLSNVMAGAPAVADLKSMKYRTEVGGEWIEAYVPPILLAKLEELAKRRATTLSAMIWRACQELVDSLD